MVHFKLNLRTWRHWKYITANKIHDNLKFSLNSYLPPCPTFHELSSFQELVWSLEQINKGISPQLLKKNTYEDEDEFDALIRNTDEEEKRVVWIQH